MSFEHFKHTLENVAERTSLKPDFINRAHSKLSGFFKDYRTYGDNNQVQFNDSGLMLWDRIAQLKKDNKNLPEIAKVLEQDLQNGSQNQAVTPKPGSETLQNRSQNQVWEKIYSTTSADELDRISNLYERLLASKEEEIEAKEQALDAVSANIKILLPEGKTAEQLKAELNEKAKQELELTDLRTREQKARDITIELKALEGKWGVGKRRKRLIEKLAQIQNESD